MRIEKEYLEKIRPESSKLSEKYSWNLYRFLKKYSKQHYIYVYKGCNEASRCEQLFFAITLCGTKGADNIGIFESQLRRLGKTATIELLSYDAFDFSRFHEVSKEFFSDYLKNGKCAFSFPSHQEDIEDTNRFETLNDHTKRCKWCGKTFHKEIKQIIVEKTVWEEKENEEIKS